MKIELTTSEKIDIFLWDCEILDTIIFSICEILMKVYYLMTSDPKESKQTKSQQIPTKVIRFTPFTPLKTNMEPENAILKKETDLQKNTNFWLPC